MFYYSKHSRKKVIHLEDCYMKDQIAQINMGTFETLQEAYNAGYRLCRHCSVLWHQYRKIKNDFLAFSMAKGIGFNYTDRALNVNTFRSRWKIVVADTGRSLALYHKNKFQSKDDSESPICGYHLQKSRHGTIRGYFEYIAHHEDYRYKNPLPTAPGMPTPPQKGTKRYRAQQKKYKRWEKKRAVRNTLALIDALQAKETTGYIA